MDDIKRRDRQVLLSTLFRWYKLPLYAAFLGMAAVFLQAPGQFAAKWLFIGASLFAFGYTLYRGYIEHLDKRWHDRRFLQLYKACVDRRERLNEALARLRKSKIADLKELPRSADKLLSEIYYALRRADLVAHEIHLSESRSAPPVVGSVGRYIADDQAQELFKVADRNIAEYSHHFRRVIAGVERSEAQAVVYATTLDTLRVRMLGYRLTSTPEADTKEFLNVITEAKMQFQAIDQALEEIELTPFPQTITIIPDTPTNQNLPPGGQGSAEPQTPHAHTPKNTPRVEGEAPAEPPSTTQPHPPSHPTNNVIPTEAEGSHPPVPDHHDPTPDPRQHLTDTPPPFPPKPQTQKEQP